MILPPALWLTVFLLIPLAVVFKISFSEAVVARPPYVPLLTFSDDGSVQLTLHLTNYLFLCQDNLYIAAYLNSIKIAGDLDHPRAARRLSDRLFHRPLARPLAQHPADADHPAVLELVPAARLRLDRLPQEQRRHQQFPRARSACRRSRCSRPISRVYVGIVYTYLPFMILPLYTNLVKLDDALLEASADLGARPFRTFLSVTLPLSMPGIIAGSMLVFIPAIGEYVIPTLLGGPSTLMIGRVLWDEFFANRDWPLRLGGGHRHAGRRGRCR